ncbi:MAG: hypothetical protein WCR54_03105 [Clostridia bacterium]
MLITAHGGSLETKRNTQLFFDKIKDYNVDIIEVDIRKKGNLIYLSHMPTFFPKTKITLRYAFEFCKKYNYKINCDLKQFGLISPVIALAEEIGVTDKIIFTGNTISEKDISTLTAGSLYLNKSIVPYKPTVENVKNIKNYITKLNNINVAGLNYNYKFLSDEFLEECKKQNLAVSIFTPDTKQLLEKFTCRQEIYNLTTNHPDWALELLNKEIKK